MNTSLFFVGNYNMSSDSKGIYSVILDEDTGKMKIVASNDACENPSYLAVRGKTLYVANEVEDAAYITAYRIQEDGNIEWFDRMDVPGAGMCYLALWKDGTYISGANYTTGNIFTCSLHTDGSFHTLTYSYQNEGNSKDTIRQESAHMHSIIPSVNSDYWLAADLGCDALFYYQADTNTGTFNLLQKLDMEPGEGPRHFVFNQEGTYGYLVSELRSNIYTFKIEDHKLMQVHMCPACLQETEENYAAHITMSMDEKYIYVSNRGANTIDMFEILKTGELKPISSFPSHGQYPRHFEISPSNKYIVVAHQKSNEVVCCEYNEDGRIGSCVDKIKVPKAINICFMK